ncbi:LacI family DNA-binding transcriptional regulator [Demequina sp. NBRC 110055]|uniref:LacI family DNA-binding transcriptional regulator n=1 Tax=Demequina sp. NBRC 110055 TaxID=1570344 RepID=UPI000A01E828|nr:LacI family DNA-binding transcriptional regulator [Demequina sp. NBRC 110055]
MKRVRLADVAEHVGVSTKTVSNVVNGTGWVSDAVRDRILIAIDELGYRPNLAARQLRQGRSGTIALCIPNLAEPYFAELAAELVDRAQERGLTVLVTQTKAKADVELAVIEAQRLPAVDGIILSPLALTAADIEARRSEVPLLLIGELGQTIAGDAVAHVGPDNTAAAADATRYLIDHGCRRIAVVGVQPHSHTETARLRLAGYRQALDEAGIGFDESLLVEVENYNRAEGTAAVESLLERGTDFDGVFCFNDSLAFGAHFTLARHGYSQPDQVRVIGYDAIEEGKYTVPPLASVDPGVASASTLMLDLLADGARGRRGHIEVPHHLVER